MKKSDRELQFSCQRCLHCCSGEPGYVFLTRTDIEKVASYLGVTEEEFLAIYCRRIDYGTCYMFSLKERDNYDCIFLRSYGCSIYDVRPHQCSTYPFWKGLADDPSAWKKEMSNCPGIGKGRRYSAEEVEKLIESNQIEPAYIILKN